MKKDFSKDRDIELLDMFTGEPEEPEQEESTAGKLILKKRPTRSERLQLLVTPDLLKAIKKAARKNKMSINGFINAVLEAYLNQ